ncbi:hypothetical protein [Algoriphagus marinus]|uniref:hypothetical protein n=1 Tax=Algoriphagus marinus TaxID=1925762 RepID=UPI00094B9B66|nr:hypothetical protein [Algoriphagus marinus]
MKLEKQLNQRSHYFFAGFFVLILIGFWFTYFTRILDQENYRMHTHGIALIIWCLMLVVQPFLIRARMNSLHKSIGKFSYVLVPILIFTTIDLLRYKLNGVQLSTMDYFFVALVINALIAFVIFYGLSIYHKKRVGLHARYMICTIFPMVTPATDRIIGFYFPSLIPHLYTIEGNPILPVVGFLMADLILVGLSIWDWKSHKRWNVFPFALLVVLMYHYSVLYFYKFDFWKTFSSWVVG